VVDAVIAMVEERMNHASCETTSANEWSVLEDRARSLDLCTWYRDCASLDVARPLGFRPHPFRRGAAVLFGLGHLPATAAVAPLSAALLVRAVVLNGAAGLVFGELYKRHGLEWAMASHFGVDIVAHVALV
jgi:Type II CAAX prenyl endopeptidase Rce1-like